MVNTKWASPTGSNALPETPRWLHAYGDFIVKNASSVSQIESTLRSLTYIIPGRFRDSEIASESRSSSTSPLCLNHMPCGIQLLSLYHDSLLARAVARLPLGRQPSHPTPHHRYTRFWTQKSPRYQRIALTLQMIQYTELLCEMAAKRRSERSRWRVVVFLEMIKAVCRLLMLRLTNSRPLLTPPLPERDFDPRMLEDDHREGERRDSIPPPLPPRPGSSPRPPFINEEEEEEEGEEYLKAMHDTKNQRWSMPRTGMTLPALPPAEDITNYLLSKVLTAEDVKPPKALLHRVSGMGQIAECLYILRPVIYALAMQHWCMSGDTSTTTPGQSRRGKKNRSWTPWLIGLSIEYGARQLAKRDFQERVAGGFRGLTGLEREELRRRGWGLGWWLMRGAFYENITKSSLEKISSTLRNSLLGYLGGGLVGGVLEDYMYLWDQYYFSTASL
ncbi:MAG: hypothetical protein M1823_002137 [Watsoniomyces obsoletus]|nr:MAG: hypothetical protein M1823_002137 [Watsoniomyces obsoletus]